MRLPPSTTVSGSVRNLFPIKESRGAAAFALVEMLAVVAVIGVLAAVIVPVLGKIRESTERLQCVNNLRQIAGGLTAYVSENDGLLPAQSSVNGWPNQNTTWGYAIWPYVHGDMEGFSFPDNDLQLSVTGRNRNNVFCCPKAARGVWVGVEGGAVSPSHFSYGLNNGAHQMTLRMPFLSAASASQTALVLESSTPRGDYYSFFANGTVPHAKRTNVLFFDGHVESRLEREIPRRAGDVFWKIGGA